MREETIHEYEPLTNKSTSKDLLANAEVRKPIIMIVGEDNIYEFRKTMQPGDLLRKVGDNIIVGSGCEPVLIDHCALFAIDITNNLAWAVESDGTNGIFEPKTAKLWGVLTDNDVVPLREIRGWLYKHKIAQGSVSFVPLPDSLTQLYKQPRKTVAKIETSPPSPQSVTQVAPTKPVLSQAPSSEHLAIPCKERAARLLFPFQLMARLP
jgi:hypothetical protein